MGIDWAKIEDEYVAGNITLRELAVNHGISKRRVERESAKCGWAEKRDAYRCKVSEMVRHETAEAAAQAQIDTLRRIDGICEKLLFSLETAVTELSTATMRDTESTSTTVITNGEKVTKTATQEHIRQEQSTIDVARLARIADAIKTMQSIGNGGSDDKRSSEFDKLLLMING